MLFQIEKWLTNAIMVIGLAVWLASWWWDYKRWEGLQKKFWKDRHAWLHEYLADEAGYEWTQTGYNKRLVFPPVTIEDPADNRQPLNPGPVAYVRPAFMDNSSLKWISIAFVIIGALALAMAHTPLAIPILDLRRKN